MNDTASVFARIVPAYLDYIPLDKQLWPIFVAIILFMVGVILAMRIIKIVAKILGEFAHSIAMMLMATTPHNTTAAILMLISWFTACYVLFIITSVLEAIGQPIETQGRSPDKIASRAFVKVLNKVCVFEVHN